MNIHQDISEGQLLTLTFVRVTRISISNLLFKGNQSLSFETIKLLSEQQLVYRLTEGKHRDKPVCGNNIPPVFRNKNLTPLYP